MAFILSSDNTQETNYGSSNVSLSGEEACPLTPLTLAGAISIDLNASGTVINRTHQHDIYMCFLDMLKAQMLSIEETNRKHFGMREI